VGEGETFRVDKCIYDKQTVAVKHIKLGASQPDNHGLNKRLRSVISEIRIMYHAPLREHPNILSILGYGWRQSGQAPIPYIVVEYAMFGSLRQYLTESERSLRTKIIMAGDIAAGLNALHQCDIVHGDLKLDNVVVLQSWDRPPGTVAKLCDFGHAIVLSGEKRYLKYFGTSLYVYPNPCAPIVRLISCHIKGIILLRWNVKACLLSIHLTSPNVICGHMVWHCGRYSKMELYILKSLGEMKKYMKRPLQKASS